jgi:molecular chaperone GrpE
VSDPDESAATPDADTDPGIAPDDAYGEGAAADPGATELTVEELVGALEEVTAQRDQYLADLQRVSADFANFRKQTEKRNAEFVAHAGSRVAEALLPVLDACDAAAQQGVVGVEPIALQLRAVLENAGLELIADENEAFDPNRHEAAMTEPGDDDQDTPIVAEVLRNGYAWNGRVLRAAMVKVKG